MNAENLKNISKTDWEWLEAGSDEGIDYKDIPPLEDSFFKRAMLRLPHQPVTITLKIDPEILAWFKARDGEYEQRMNAALRIYVEAHESARLLSVAA